MAHEDTSERSSANVGGESIGDADGLAALQSRLAERDHEIASLRRRMDLERSLREAGAIDLDAACTLIDAADVKQATASEPSAAVEALRRRAPYLFAAKRDAPRSGVPSASSPRAAAPLHDPVERAAAEAHASGRRADVLRYLRLKRSRA
jgi:hypothetical protein